LRLFRPAFYECFFLFFPLVYLFCFFSCPALSCHRLVGACPFIELFSSRQDDTCTPGSPSGGVTSTSFMHSSRPRLLGFLCACGVFGDPFLFFLFPLFFFFFPFFLFFSVLVHRDGTRPALTIFLRTILLLLKLLFLLSFFFSPLLSFFSFFFFSFLLLSLCFFFFFLFLAVHFSPVWVAAASGKLAGLIRKIENLH